VIIHAGTVIGSDGAGFAHRQMAIFESTMIGNVIVEDGVEIDQT
jgi:UDP-3-O-[3-hydroxymyristoyl] glucosamine N-acyltransferase